MSPDAARAPSMGTASPDRDWERGSARGRYLCGSELLAALSASVFPLQLSSSFHQGKAALLPPCAVAAGAPTVGGKGGNGAAHCGAG